MRIRTKVGMSLDGYMATTEGIPVHGTLPSFVPGESHGLGEFLQEIDAVIVGRTTFDLGYMFWEQGEGWAWDGRKVFVLTSRPLPEALPEGVAGAASSPEALLDQLRSADLDGDVHLVGGKSTIHAFRDIGAIDEFGVMVLPLVLSEGLRLFDGGGSRTALEFDRQVAYPDGTVEIIYQTGSGGQA